MILRRRHAFSACLLVISSIAVSARSERAWTFLPEKHESEKRSVSLLAAAGQDGQIRILVSVSETPGVFGAAFDLLFDPATLQYEGWKAGEVLERGEASVTYQVGEPAPGRIVIGASRLGGTSVDVQERAPLIEVRFRPSEDGSTTIRFGAQALYDDSKPPRRIPEVHWRGGTLSIGDQRPQ